MRRWLAVLVVTAAWLAPAAAVEVVDPSEVEVGAAGVCVTEVEGGRLVEIPLTVIGHVDAVAPEGEMLLVRLDDERFEHVGIAAGMSGSPVYVGGRLLGALAFGWPFAKDPIGGVTPFTRMQGLGEPAAAPSQGVSRRPELGELLEEARDGTLGERLVDWLLPASQDGPAPLPLAVGVGGASQGSVPGWLATGWRRLNWVTGVAGGATSDEPDEIRPGSMIAGVMVRGDATVAVGGTVTEVRDGKVWAFGHPFLGGGETRIPLADANVVTVFASQLSSFKVFSVGRPAGALTADRTHGVWGELGTEVPMVPVEVDASGRSYAFECVRHPVLLPLMVAYLTQACHAAHGRTFGEQTIAARVEVEYEGGRTAVLTNSFAQPDAPAMAAATASALLAYLEGSTFVAPEVERVRVALEAVERNVRAQVVDVVTDRLVVAPGQELTVRVRLQANHGPETTERVQVRVPPTVGEGKLDLVVADGSSWAAYDLQMRPLRPASFADELRLIDRLVPATHLVLAFERPEVGVVMPGVTAAVPPSLVVGLRSGLGPNLGTTTHRVVQRDEVVLPYPVLGAQRITLVVRTETRGLVEQTLEGP